MPKHSGNVLRQMLTRTSGKLQHLLQLALNNVPVLVTRACMSLEAAFALPTFAKLCGSQA